MERKNIFIPHQILLRRKRLFGRARLRWEDNTRTDLREIISMKIWKGYICLKTGVGGRVLWARRRTFGFHKRRGITSLPALEELCSTKLIYQRWTRSEIHTRDMPLQNFRFSCFQVTLLNPFDTSGDGFGRKLQNFNASRYTKESKIH
jgi:hypothetical protein